jgi:hypothetical protein
MASMRQRVNSLEEDLDRQRQKAITATEAYQKMVVDLQQRHAGTVAELEMALKELEQLQGYKDLYSKIESGQASKDSQGMAAMMQENLGLKSEIATLRQELQAEKERTDVAGRANSRQSVLDDEQVREHEEVRRTERILREENARLNRELESAKEELGQERGGGMASARAIAEGRASFHKGLKEFTANTLAGLEEELATWKTRATVVRPRPFRSRRCFPGPRGLTEAWDCVGRRRRSWSICRAT